MTLNLNPRFSYLMNTAIDRGFIVAPSGATSVVNADAFGLLTGAASDLSDYQDFVAVAQRQQWLVDGPVDLPASVRTIAREHHLRRVQYEINLACNLECAHCYCSSSPRASRGKDTAFVLDLVRQAAEMGVLHFDVTGGEPTLRRDLLEIVSTIRAHGMVPSLLTNCTLVTKDLVSQLKAAGLAAVQTSLDARTPAVHDEIRGQVGAFDRAIRGLRLFQEAGVPISVSICLNRKNAHEVPELVRFMNELGVPFRLDRVIPAGRTTQHDDPLALPNHEYYALIQRFFGADASNVAKKVCDSVNLDAQSFLEPSCGVGASYLFIKHDGRAALCPTMTEAESPAFGHADLSSMSLAQAWDTHPTFTRFRNMQCENARICPSGKTCRGGCRSNAYLLHGRVDSPDEVHCNIHKNRTPTYRPMILEYARLRAEGAMPPGDRHPAEAA